MKAFFCALTLLAALSQGGQAENPAPPNTEYLLVSGGPALREWEDLRREQWQHDRWWANFIRAATLRMEQLRESPVTQTQKVTWMIYRPGYVSRQQEEGKPFLTWINDLAKKHSVRVVWFDNTPEFLNYLNRGQDRSRLKIGAFEYFGHSNKHAFLFDYSNVVAGAAASWLHERDLAQVSRSAFHRDAFCKSWGCHTAESMSSVWRKKTGRRLIGAFGKTDYTSLSFGRMPIVSPGGRWSN
ncbi:MAG: hypothetical protein AAF555_11320 [Verrucomicrobiota bacterium]